MALMDVLKVDSHQTPLIFVTTATTGGGVFFSR